MNTPVYRCSKTPTDFFSYAGKKIERAKRACLGITEAAQEPCPLLIACRTRAREEGEWGTWGGESERERILAGYPPQVKTWIQLHGDAPIPTPLDGRLKQPPDCGTIQAVWRHRRRREELDDDCLDAASTYEIDRRQKIQLARYLKLMDAN